MTIRLCLLALTLVLAGCLPAADPVPPYPPLAVTPGEPLLSVTLRATGARAMMKRVAVNGEVETWMSQDRYTISLHHGVVVATRGFGFDLMGGDAGATLTALAGGQDGIYSRRMRYLTADNHSTWLAAGCSIGTAEPEDGLVRLAESCQARNARFTNLYWTDAQGRILRSRQWIAPELGYLDIVPARQ